MEGNVYKCKWEKKDTCYTIKLVNGSNLIGIGDSIESAEEDLCAKICQEYGDGEAVLDFINDLPIDEHLIRYSKPVLFSVTGNDCFGQIVNKEKCLEISKCDNCSRKQIRRVGKESLIIKNQPKADISFGQGAVIFSRAFLDNLNQKLLNKYELRSVTSPTGSRKKYFEIVGNHLTQYVGIPGFPGLLNNKCPKCKVCCFTYFQYGELYNFVAIEKLPKTLPEFFLVLDPLGGTDFIMRGDSYNKIRGNKGTKNIVQSRVWVVADDKYITDNDQEDYPKELYHKLLS